ncbi:MAG TPA: hypothetical protein EYP56_06735 [Planctomycetaceae bacterium]|nr:hypothetical protein [Planctomycetaceae bacterium]
MPHWIGYNVQDTLIRSFLGALAGIVLASLAVRSTKEGKASRPRPDAFQFGVSGLLLFTTLVGFSCAIFALSAYVGFFVFLELFFMVGTFAADVRSGLADAGRGTEKRGNSDTSGPSEVLDDRTPRKKA